MSRERPSSVAPRSVGHDKGALAHHQWWGEARRASLAGLPTELQASRSAPCSPIPQGILDAVARHGGGRASALTAARSEAPADGRYTAPHGATDPFAAPPAAPQRRRNMTAGAQPPPTCSAAYVKDRAVGSLAQARCSERASLMSYLQAHSGTVGRLLGTPLNPAGGKVCGNDGDGDGRQTRAAPCSWSAPLESTASVSGSSAAPQRAGVFVWEDEPPMEAAFGMQMQEQVLHEQPPEATPSRLLRSPIAAGPPAERHQQCTSSLRVPSPQLETRGGRVSLATSAAMAVAAAGRASPPHVSCMQPCGVGSGGCGSSDGRGASPLLGSACAALGGARRASSAAICLEGSLGLSQYVAGDPVRAPAGFNGLDGPGAGGGCSNASAAACHSAVALAIRARVSSAREWAAEVEDREQASPRAMYSSHSWRTCMNKRVAAARSRAHPGCCSTTAPQGTTYPPYPAAPPIPRHVQGLQTGPRPLRRLQCPFTQRWQACGCCCLMRAAHTTPQRPRSTRWAHYSRCRHRKSGISGRSGPPRNKPWGHAQSCHLSLHRLCMKQQHLCTQGGQRMRRSVG
jgi:hypothetical protein